DERRFHVTRRFEETHSVEDCIAVKLPQIAVKLIGAATVCCIDYSAAATPKFGAIGIGLHLELLHGVGRNLDNLAGKALIAGAVGIIIHAIEQEIVDSITQTIDVEGGFASSGGNTVL